MTNVRVLDDVIVSFVQFKHTQMQTPNNVCLCITVIRAVLKCHFVGTRKRHSPDVCSMHVLAFTYLFWIVHISR